MARIKLKKIALLGGTMLASTMFAYFAKAADATAFTLDNQSDVVIHRVQARPDYSEVWGENLLGSSMLRPRNQRRFDVRVVSTHCIFDIHVEWANGLYRIFIGRDFCENPYVAFDGGRGLVVSNESLTTIASVEVKPHREESWSADRLEGEEAIAPGRERVVMLEEQYRNLCVFDVRLGSQETNAEYNRNLCDDPEIVFFEGSELTVANVGEETIYFVRVSVDHKDQGWGQNLLGEGRALSRGDELLTRLHQFPASQCLFDVLVGEADREHVYEDLDVCRIARLVHPRDVVISAPSKPIVSAKDLAVGEAFRDCDGGCPWMVVVDGGAFERGSWERDDEAPVTNVTVPGPFAVGQFEVSVGQFGEFASDSSHDGGSGCHVKSGRSWRLAEGRGAWRWTEERSWRDPGFDQDDSHPVVCVSWDDAAAYTSWLGDKTGLPYRLLTEAEMELLARASVTEFKDSGRANCRDCGSRWDGKSTSPVGRLRPDRLGLSGVFGNAAEWMQDCYQSGYSNAPRDGSAWSSHSCGRRVVRGGCWATSAQKLRASGRDSGESDRRSSCVGFRVAREIGQGAGP